MNREVVGFTVSDSDAECLFIDWTTDRESKDSVVDHGFSRRAESMVVRDTA